MGGVGASFFAAETEKLSRFQKSSSRVFYSLFSLILPPMRRSLTTFCCLILHNDFVHKITGSNRTCSKDFKDVKLDSFLHFEVNTGFWSFFAAKREK